MRQYFYFLILLCFLISCQESKNNKKVIKKNLQTKILKEIEAYKIETRKGDVIVAIHNNKICSATYFLGKIEKTILMIDKEKTVRLVEVDKIVGENEKFIIVKKIK